MTIGDAAKMLGITVAEYQRHAQDFLQCEGYADDGTEYDDLHDYIRAMLDPRPALRIALNGDGTPWQKGDDQR